MSPSDRPGPDGPDPADGDRSHTDPADGDRSRTDPPDGDRSRTDAGISDRGIELVLVAAVAENGAIGADGELPWYYPEDLAHFRETTMGHPVIAGRRTYESIVDRLGEPLPGRTNVVLTGGDREFPEGAVRAGSLAEAVELAADTGSEVAYVVGGETVYEQFLDHADRMVITEVPESPDGDAFFPEIDPGVWAETSRERRGDLAFVEYERR